MVVLVSFLGSLKSYSIFFFIVSISHSGMVKAS